MDWLRGLFSRRNVMRVDGLDGPVGIAERDDNLFAIGNTPTDAVRGLVVAVVWKTEGEFTVAVANFTPVPRAGYVVGVPEPGWYREVLNSDAGIYGGSNVGNSGGVPADGPPAHGHPHSIRVALPPLGFLLLKKGG